MIPLSQRLAIALSGYIPQHPPVQSLTTGNVLQHTPKSSSTAQQAFPLLMQPLAYYQQLKLPTRVAKRLHAPNWKHIERHEQWAEKPKNTIIFPESPLYPSSLHELYLPPCMLLVKGSIDCLKRRCLAIVGSRNASAYALRQTQRFAYALAESGISIISGMAFGVDAQAHKAALAAKGATVAVLGLDVDTCSPSAHMDLYYQLCEEGGVVSEVPLGSCYHKNIFPKRNRIIAALSDAVLIAEARARSGSLITADYALDLGKTIMALPGRIDHPCAEGSNTLLQHGAYCVQSLDDVWAALDALHKRA